MNKIIFFAITLQAPFLLAMDENNASSIGNKRSRNEDFTNEAPPAKKSAVFPLHQACSSGNEDEVIKLLSGTHVNIEELVHELNNEGLSPMQCLEDSYKKIMRTDLASRNSESETKIPKIAALLVMHGSKLPKDDYFQRFRLSPFLHKALIEITTNLNDENPITERSNVTLKHIINSGLIELDSCSHIISENIYCYFIDKLKQSLNNENQKDFEQMINIIDFLEKNYEPLKDNLAENCLEFICTHNSFNDNHMKIARQLVNFKINFNGSCQIFFYAVGRKKFELASLFLDSGADIDMPYNSSQKNIRSTCLYRAIESQTPEQATFLINKGADIFATDTKNNTYLHIICQATTNIGNDKNALETKEQFQKIIELLLKKGLSKNINMKNADGDTPIMLASSVEIVDLLLEFGAIIELPIVRNISALRACRVGNIELLKYWQKLGMDFSTVKGENIENKFFEELYQSPNSLDTNIINYLLEHNADINGSDNNNMSILMRACYDKPVDHIKWLIDNGANIDHSRMQYGKTETVLHIAHKQANTVSKKEKIDLLLGSGCTVPEDLLNDAHIKKRLQQKTDLHSAVVAGELEIVQKLLAEGAELWIDVETDAGEFLIDIASGLANRDIYDLLLSKSKKIPKVHSKSARK